MAELTRFCVLDFETTGLSPEHDEVIEFGAVHLNPSPDGSSYEKGLELASLCRPHKYISRCITQLTGINKLMTEPYPPFERMVPTLSDFIGERTLVCHNVPFDWGFLSAYLRRSEIDFDPPKLDTLKLARQQLPSLNSYKLGEVARYLRVPAPSAHRALGDAQTTAGILIQLLQRQA